jgi:hypothetical protein
MRKLRLLFPLFLLGITLLLPNVTRAQTVLFSTFGPDYGAVKMGCRGRRLSRGRGLVRVYWLESRGEPGDVVVQQQREQRGDLDVEWQLRYNAIGNMTSKTDSTGTTKYTWDS